MQDFDVGLAPQLVLFLLAFFLAWLSPGWFRSRNRKHPSDSFSGG